MARTTGHVAAAAHVPIGGQREEQGRNGQREVDYVRGTKRTEAGHICGGDLFVDGKRFRRELDSQIASGLCWRSAREVARGCVQQMMFSDATFLKLKFSGQGIDIYYVWQVNC